MNVRKNVLMGSLGLCLALSMLVFAGCGSDSTSTTPPPPPPAAPKLTFSLYSTLDGGGSIKATSTTMTKVELLGTSGAVVKTATLSSGTAAFDLTGVTAGPYFIRVTDPNNTDDSVLPAVTVAPDANLVPTIIDDPSVNISQFAGKKLRKTTIGTNDPATATYVLKTFSKGQAEHTVVKYSNGAVDATPVRYAYSVIKMKTTPQVLENRVMGSAALLSSQTGGGTHVLGTWALGGANHGKDLASCPGCHASTISKAATYAAITTGSGWCFKCHNGQGGDATGMVDPAQ